MSNDVGKALGDQAKKGIRFEKLFMKFAKRHKVDCERGDKKDLREPDFYVKIRVDPKVRNTPFFKAFEEVGIDADKCVTLDMEKFISYRKWGRNVVLLLYVNYKPHFDTDGVYLITTDKINEIRKNKRRVKDFPDHQKCTNKTRIYISTDEMVEISDLLDMGVISKYVMR